MLLIHTHAGEAGSRLPTASPVNDYSCRLPRHPVRYMSTWRVRACLQTRTHRPAAKHCWLLLSSPLAWTWYSDIAVRRDETDVYGRRACMYALMYTLLLLHTVRGS